MREYETLYILHPDVQQGRVEEISSKLKSTIGQFQGHVLTAQNLGKKKLAYRVAKQQFGNYFFVNYLGAGALVAEIERILKYDDLVLKFLTVKTQEKVKNVEERLNEKTEINFFTCEEPSLEKGSAEVERDFVSHKNTHAASN